MDQASFKMHFFYTEVIENLRATDESQVFAEMYDTETESTRYLQHVTRIPHTHTRTHTRTHARTHTRMKRSSTNVTSCCSCTCSYKDTLRW